MSFRPTAVCNLLASAVLAALTLASPAHSGELRPAQSNDDLNNPHRGFMLWGTTVGAEGGMPDNWYGASIYQIYAPWREIETADEQYDWDGFEKRHLKPILDADPNATFVIRPVADYPNGVATKISYYYNKTEGQLERDYPKFLEQPPLNIVGRDYKNCGGDGPGRAPDYNSPAMRQQLQQFIKAFGRKYNGDARISAIHVGLLGFWGEWHTSGCEAWEPDATTRKIVREAYDAAFVLTPLQTRYARASDISGVTFGISEDYFPSFTAMCNRFTTPLPECDDGGWWNLEWGFRNEVPDAKNNWISNPIAGESPLDSQKNTWTSRTADIVALIKQYHLSWLGPAGLHEENGHTDKMKQIKRALGYEFTVRQVVWPDSMRAGAAVSVQLSVENTGSAPLYHGYQTELHWVDAGGVTRGKAAFDYPLNTLLPPPAGPNVQTRSVTVPAGLAPGSYSLRLAIADIKPGRLGIAPQNGNRDSSRRLPLGTVTVAAAANR